MTKIKEALKWLNESDSLLADFIWLLLFYFAIRLVIYPLLGLLLHTSFPIVAVVSGSMDHHGQFDNWWNSSYNRFFPIQRKWYNEHNITYSQFKKFPFSNGLNVGDVIILHGKKPDDIKIGDIIVFTTPSGKAIIHRVVKRWYDQKKLKWFFQTKGDANPESVPNYLIEETQIVQDRVIGVACFKIPLLGYPKVWLENLKHYF